MTRAAGLDPDADVQRQALSPPETAQGLKDGTLDAMVRVGGPPVSGITDLMTPSAADITAEQAPKTDPVPLHDGAKRYFG